MTEQTIFYLVGNAFRIYLLLYFQSIFSSPKRKARYFHLIYFWIFFLVNSLIYLHFFNPVANILNNLLFLYGNCLFLNGKWQQNLFIPIGSFIVNALIEGVAALVPILNSSEILNSKAGISMVIVDLIFFAFILVVKKMMEHQQSLPIQYWLLLFTIPISSCFACGILVYDYTIAPIQLLVVYVALIVVNIAAFWLYDRLSAYYSTQNELRAAKEQLTLHHAQVSSHLKSEEKIDSILHDLNNHLDTLYSYLEQQNTASAQKYILTLKSDLHQVNQNKFCGNPCIDAILSLKKESAEQKGISFQAILQIPKESVIDDVDMSTILFNLLDNAIEAQEHVTDSEKFIQLKMVLDSGLWMIRVRNSCNPSITIKKGTIPSSTKPAPYFHGYGIKNVIACAEKYDGTYTFTAEDGVFTALLFICTPVSFFEQLQSPDAETAANAVK